ncbi:uncharacterized protein cubi_00832 [Cryptosporidium ubiquitum]|uniref:Uncharacterized protein n=1 Tax=Cryptosporidium ubiquitum TaxID=857276 RepID=A0A1J4MIJ9_9CRYT|nr:uncharacterized protein cubi_00832 [Cryptosporidium ubiquitum]OII72860.1 hypothetical protein cubi_00832 [Cryptosporidium ubiquitum]
MSTFNIPKFKIVILSVFCDGIVETPKQAHHSSSGSAISNSGWFQLYAASTKQNLERDLDTGDQYDSGEERLERIVDCITASIKGLFPNIPNELILKYGDLSALISHLDVDVIYISDTTFSTKGEFEEINSNSFLNQKEAFENPLVNVVLCNFDRAPPISSSPNSFSHIFKLCELSNNYHEIEFLLVGFSASKYPETERFSKKNFEKFRTEVQRLFGNNAKDKCIWVSESNQLDTPDYILHVGARRIHTRLLEEAANAINARIKTVIDYILDSRNEGPKLSHSLKLTEGLATPEILETPELLTSGMNSPVSSRVGGTQCRKLQISDMWYQWILDIINKSDLLGLVFFRLGLANEALLIYEQLLDDFREQNNPFIKELQNQTIGFAGIVATKDPLLLASDCCFGDCRTHLIENNTLIHRDKLILPLNFNKLILSKRSTYFDIFQMVFLRQIFILLSVKDFQKVCNRVHIFSRKFSKEILSKIDHLKYKFACHLWIFRFIMTVAAIGFPGVPSNPKYSPGPRQSTAISSLKIIIVSSILPRLIHFLGASESIDVWKHKPSTPKLPPDSNVSSMEIQTALIKWATQCISSILLNCICDFEEFSRLEEELEINSHKSSNSMFTVSNKSSHFSLYSKTSHEEKNNSSLNYDPSSKQNSDTGVDTKISFNHKNSKLEHASSFNSPSFSLFHLASKHFSLVCELLSSEIWNKSSSKFDENKPSEELIDNQFLQDMTYNLSGDAEQHYNLKELYCSLNSPSKVYRILCEVVGMAAMDYISSGQLKTAISLPWGIIFENKDFLKWMLEELNNETSTFVNYETSKISDICFCYRFVRIWLDFPTILLPIPLQWTSLSNISQKLLLKLFAKKVNPVSLSYINNNDSYLLQAEIGIRQFLSILNSNNPNFSQEDGSGKDFKENICLEDQLILETYISKCLENSNIDKVNSLQWEFPSHPNLWAHLYISDSSSEKLKDVPKLKMKAYINLGGQTTEKNETLDSYDSQTKSFKGVTLKIVERQILMALLGGGKLIRLPAKALPCCGLLDPLKPVQGYFYVFHEILRPSGRLFLKSPNVLSPLLSPLGSSGQQTKVSDPGNVCSKIRQVEGEMGQMMESQKVEQQEAGDTSNSQRMKNSGRSGSNNSYNSWFQKKSSRHERSSSFSNSELEHVREGRGNITNSLVSNKKKDGSPRQWMWEIVAGFKWGGSSYGSNSKSKVKASSFNGSLYSEKRNEVLEVDGLDNQEKVINNSSIHESSLKNVGGLHIPSSTLENTVKVEENLSPSKIITVPTPGPSNWVITEASKSNSKKSVPLSPKLTLSPKNEEPTQCLVTPPNLWVHKLAVPGIPSRFILLVYLGLSSPVYFGSVWLRFNGIKWVLLENTIMDSSKKNKILLEPGLNSIELDIFCEGDGESSFFIDSIGFSDRTSFSIPINFLWVIPLGTLPSPHILPRVISEFQIYERGLEISFGKKPLNSSIISKTNKDELECNRDNAWNPLKKWTTLYSFGIRNLSEMFSMTIQFGEITQYSNSSESVSNNLLKTYTGEKKSYRISVKIEEDWIQIYNVDMEVTLSFQQSKTKSIKIFSEEMELVQIDGLELKKTLKLEINQNLIKLPSFSNECIIQIPIMFDMSPMKKSTQVTFGLDFNAKIKYQETEACTRHNFVFQVEPQMDLINIQPVPNLDYHSLPFYYFELLFETACKRVLVDKIITMFPNDLENLNLFGIMAPVELKPREIESYKDLGELCSTIEYSLSHPMTIESKSKPLKLIWIVPKSELQKSFTPQILISTVSLPQTEKTELSVSGPFQIPMETLYNFISLRKSIQSTNGLLETSLDGLSLDHVEHPSYSKVDSEFSLVIYLNYTFGREEIFSYCLNYFGDADEDLDNKGCWWFIGARNGHVQAKPGSKIRLEFRIVPLINGLLKLPSINFGCSNSRPYSYPYFTLSDNSRKFYLGKQVVI